MDTTDRFSIGAGAGSLITFEENDCYFAEV